MSVPSCATPMRCAFFCFMASQQPPVLRHKPCAASVSFLCVASFDPKDLFSQPTRCAYAPCPAIGALAPLRGDAEGLGRPWFRSLVVFVRRPSLRGPALATFALCFRPMPYEKFNDKVAKLRSPCHAFATIELRRYGCFLTSCVWCYGCCLSSFVWSKESRALGASAPYPLWNDHSTIKR